MKIQIDKLKHTDSGNFFMIAGPCVIENEEQTQLIAYKLLQLSDELKIPFIFKASYRKDNRTSSHSFQGIAQMDALKILRDISKDLQVPVLTDVHSVNEAWLASQFVDVLQIPAFLCRQTSLLEAAALTGLPINVKKGQFLAPTMMQYVVEKIKEKGNRNIMLTERGTMFGYDELIVDFRGIPIMQSYGYPVVLDITHSCQRPNTGAVTGGNNATLLYAKLGITSGVDGIFFETHPNPHESLSDASTIFPLDAVSHLLKILKRIRNVYE